MSIQFCSDLHLEFPLNKIFLRENPIKPVGEILLIAGDLIPFAHIEAEQDFFSFLSDNYAQVYWVPGNHEYYRSDIALKNNSFSEKIRDNVTLLNNTSTIFKDVRLIFSTLWSRLSPEQESVIMRSLADFHLIRNAGNKITAVDYNRLHEQCVGFLHKEFQSDADMKTIVVTHHIPTFQNYPLIYRNSNLNSAFATNVDDLIITSSADYWIYGHHHQYIPDFQIGKTMLVNNQLGYIEFREHHNFDPRGP